MISLTAEYALRAIVWIASRADVAVGTRDIAEATEVPVGYMSKVLQELARADLVRSRPGRSGGFVLSRKPDEISVLDVVNVVDCVERIERCPLGRRHHQGKLCPLHRRLDQAAAMIEQAFADSTIAELAAEAAEEDALCRHQQAAPRTSAIQSPRRRTGTIESGRVVSRRRTRVRSDVRSAPR